MLEGNPIVAGQAWIRHETTFFRRDGDVVELESSSKFSSRIVLIAGRPLDG